MTGLDQAIADLKLRTERFRVNHSGDMPIPQFTLTEDQNSAFLDILDFYKSKNKAYLLRGYAGTGKTTLVNTIINNLPREDEIAVCATTNKAVKVIKEKVSRTCRISFVTIHKLLRTVRYITDEGEAVFAPDPEAEVRAKLVIVDECSMLDKKFFRYLLMFRRYYNFKILFVGDDCQINPVKEKQSPSFRFARFMRGFKLTKIVRQGDDSMIIPLSINIRERINQLFTSQDVYQNISLLKDVIVLPATDKDRTRRIIDSYFLSEEYQQNPNHCKVIGWTNDLVNRSNKRIRQLIYGEPKYIEVGETLIANSPIKYQKDIQDCWITTNDEFKVVSYVEGEAKYEPDSLFPVTLKIYGCKVQYNGDEEVPIVILHPDSVPAYNKICADLERKARSLKKAGAASSDVRKAWAEYFGFKEYFADFKYNHALTCHKSQGSTYDVVFCYEFDIMNNHWTEERNRILYTAVTRAAKKLYLIV